MRPRWCPLPWDHAYGDRRQLAVDFPLATRIEVFEPATDVHRGLSRANSGESWSGENVSLLDRRARRQLIQAGGHLAPRVAAC